MSAPIDFSNSTGCFFVAFFRSFFSAVLEELATGVSASTLEVLASGFSAKIVGLASVLFFGGEVVEFVLSRYGDFDVFGVGGRGSVSRWLRDP